MYILTPKLELCPLQRSTEFFDIDISDSDHDKKKPGAVTSSEEESSEEEADDVKNSRPPSSGTRPPPNVPNKQEKTLPVTKPPGMALLNF